MPGMLSDTRGVAEDVPMKVAIAAGDAQAAMMIVITTSIIIVVTHHHSHHRLFPINLLSGVTRIVIFLT